MAWTEKIWASIARTDGSLQIDFGLGKYQNRGIIDGFGGVSRGSEQWTVRGSRELASAPEQTGVGPVQLEVVEPLKKMRFRLELNDVQPRLGNTKADLAQELSLLCGERLEFDEHGGGHGRGCPQSAAGPAGGARMRVQDLHAVHRFTECPGEPLGCALVGAGRDHHGLFTPAACRS